MPSRFNFLRFRGAPAGLAAMHQPPAGSPDEMPFLDHLEELRWRILWSVLAFVILGGVGIWIAIRFDVVGLLIDPARPFLECTEAAIAAGCDERLHFFAVTEAFYITFKLGLTLGLLMSFPIIAYQVWAFLSPALHQKEKRVIIPALYAGLVLFIGGAALAYFYVLPATIKFMMSFQTEDMAQTIGVADYIGLVTKLMVSFGLVFELPVVLVILSSLGLVTSKFLSDKRRYAIAIMAVGAALLTPGDAFAATLYMMVPLVLLYEISILLAKVMERRRNRAAALTDDVEAL